jgi:hypothetical protein
MIPRVLLGLTLMADFAAAEDPSMLRFSNQDQLPGSLKSMTADQVFWDSPIQVKPAAFWLKEVAELTLSAETPLFQANHEATLTLARGDSVRGQLAAVANEFIELDTWFAGRMRFPRVMVREVRIADRPMLLFRGPSSLEGWKQSVDPPAWKFEAAALRSTARGSIGREVNLPDEFKFSFDAEWRNSFNLSVIFLSDDVAAEKPNNGYELTFQRRSVRLQRCGTHNWIGNTQNVAELQEGEKARVEIRASVKTKTICFFVNDRIVEVWTDPNLAAGSLGKGIQFVTQDNSPVKISGIEIAKWDGVVDEQPVPENNRLANRFRDLDAAEVKPEKKPEDAKGRMTLRNGDSIAGEVTAIQDGIITLKTSFDEVKLPVGRLRSINLKPASLEEPKRMNGDVRGWFLDGSSLVFRVDQVDAESVTGYSQNFGSAKFNLKAFSRLEFNLYSPKLTAARSGGN